jgi:hypothetical protein
MGGSPQLAANRLAKSRIMIGILIFLFILCLTDK